MPATNTFTGTVTVIPTGSWSPTGSMAIPRTDFPMVLLRDGRVLVVGGYTAATRWGRTASAELYDPATGTWSSTGSMAAPRLWHTAVVLSNGRALVVGGDTASAERYDQPQPPNTFTGTLTLPSGWLTRAATVVLSGTASSAAVNTAALSNDGVSFGAWLTVTNGVPVTTTWNLGADGAGKRIYLQLRDANGVAGTVVTGTVKVDSTPPTVSMTPLATTSPTAISLAWSGSDATSGVASYDLQVRQGLAGTWTSLLSATTATSTTYHASPEAGQTYYFRVRATDVAGNASAWPADFHTWTTVDTQMPSGSLLVNGGAKATTAPNVTLTLAANDLLGSVAGMRFSGDGATWSPWQPYAGSASYTLPGGDGWKTVYAQFRDVAGNVSDSVSASIHLDTAAGTKRLVTVNDGSIWTNRTAVILTIGAPAGTFEMQLSNDGGFARAAWQPFDTRPEWEIIPYGTYVLPRTVYVRLRSSDGTISDPFQDDIIYDPVPPTGTISVRLGETASLPGGIFAQSATLQVSISATDPDNLSGVPTMRVAPAETFEQTSWEGYATVKTLGGGGVGASTVVYAQFRDGAGNVSETACARADGEPCVAPASTATPLPTATPTPTTTPTRTPTPTPTVTPTPTPTCPPTPVPPPATPTPLPSTATLTRTVGLPVLGNAACTP